MAFKVEVLRSATSYTICDPSDPSNPFSIDEADLGGAGVRNIEESGPYQDGVSHLDERLEPDTITLRIFVTANSDSALDGYRDTLNKAFKPIKGVPITLKITRDDGAIRYLDTRRTGKLAIPLLKELRPGHTHKAVVQLRVADPTYYDPALQTVSFGVPEGNWWLAYATIGTANVLEHVESPGTAQRWTNAGSVAAGQPWSIVFRSGTATPGGPFPTVAKYAFESLSSNNIRFDASTDYAGGYISANGGNSIAGAHLTGTADNIFMVHNGGTLVLYRNNTAIGTAVGASIAIPGTASGTAYWRSSVLNPGAASHWSVALPRAAAYNIALSASQRAALNDAMNGTAVSGSAYSAAVVYTGDFDSYPTLTILGPFHNPIVTNTTTGDTLDFTGGSVPAADTWTIETRYGRKSVLNAAGSSVERYLSLDSDLATFRLVADPIATGGTNVITVAGTAGGTVTAVSLSYYKRYMGY